MTDTTTDDTDAQTDPAVETVELSNGIKLDADEFVNQLHAIDRATTYLEGLQNDVEKISTGLTEEDAIRLIYGRTNGWNLSDIRGLFDTLDTISGANDEKLIVRLLADLGGVKLNEAEEFVEEVERLRQRYGDLAEE